MKTYLQCLSVFIITVCSNLFPPLTVPETYARDITLTWEANTEKDLAGYKIYYKTGSSGEPYKSIGAAEGDSPINVGNVTNYTLTGLSDEKIYFLAVTAYNTSNHESAYSNEVSTLMVTGISSTTPDGFYRTNKNVEIIITFSSRVTLARGNLVARFNTNRTLEIKPFISQDRVKAVYIIRSGDKASPLTVESLTLSDGGTLKNDAGQACSLCLPGGNNLSDNKLIVVDTTVPEAKISYSQPAPYSKRALITVRINENDNDDLHDGWEISHVLDSTSNFADNGQDGDFDHDGRTNYEEYVNGTDLHSNESPASTPPQVKKVYPHHYAGITDKTRIPANTSFCLLMEDFDDGIDLTDPTSITFTINDAVNLPYERYLMDTEVVRAIKLDPEDDDTQVKKLWLVYDRSKEEELGSFSFGKSIHIRVEAKDRRQNRMPSAIYGFEIETETKHRQSLSALPAIEALADNDPAFTGPSYQIRRMDTNPYNKGIQIINGDLHGAKIVYNTAEAVLPAFGPLGELPSPDLPYVKAVNIPMNLQTPTVFTTPVKTYIPCPGYSKVSRLSIYFFDGTGWTIACTPDGQIQPGGQGLIVPDSRVNHNDGNPSTVEITVYHLFGAVAVEDLPGEYPDTEHLSTEYLSKEKEDKGGCFITRFIY